MPKRYETFVLVRSFSDKEMAALCRGNIPKGTAVGFKDLTPEPAEKAKACKTGEELIALAQSEGVELTDEQLDGIAGGWGGCDVDDGGYY